MVSAFRSQRSANRLAKVAVHVAALMLMTLAAWHTVAAGTFQFDDFSSALSDSPGAEWRIRPLLALTFAADRALYGRNAAGYLAENLLLHCLTVLVVYALGRRIFSRPAFLPFSPRTPK
jgi:hypothetical protein